MLVSRRVDFIRCIPLPGGKCRSNHPRCFRGRWTVGLFHGNLWYQQIGHPKFIEVTFHGMLNLVDFQHLEVTGTFCYHILSWLVCVWTLNRLAYCSIIIIIITLTFMSTSLHFWVELSTFFAVRITPSSVSRNVKKSFQHRQQPFGKEKRILSQLNLAKLELEI